MSSQQLKVKSTLNLLEVVNHLEHLVASLKEGTVCIRKGEEVITLKPCESVTMELEVEVKQEKDGLREKLSLELKWEKREAAPAEDNLMVISSQEPSLEPPQDGGCVKRRPSKTT